MYSKTRYRRPFLNMLKMNGVPLEGLFEEDNIVVFEHSEHLDLAHDGLLGDLVLVGLLELLDRDCPQSAIRTYRTLRFPCV